MQVFHVVKFSPAQIFCLALHKVPGPNFGGRSLGNGFFAAPREGYLGLLQVPSARRPSFLLQGFTATVHRLKNKLMGHKNEKNPNTYVETEFQRLLGKSLLIR